MVETAIERTRFSAFAASPDFEMKPPFLNGRFVAATYD
jgi:hypothetical protein